MSVPKFIVMLVICEMLKVTVKVEMHKLRNMDASTPKTYHFHGLDRRALRAKKQKQFQKRKIKVEA